MNPGTRSRLSAGAVALIVAAGLTVAVPLSCGSRTASESADAAVAAFSAGDFAKARELCDQGLAAEGASDRAVAWKLERVRIESMASSGDAAGEVAAGLERLAGAFATQVDAAFYAKITEELSKSGNLVGAITVNDAGKKRFPEVAARFDAVMDSLKEAATHDDAAMDKLNSLGYVGGK